MAEDKNQDDSENFGLPDIEYKPLDQLDSSKPVEEPQKESSYSGGSTTESSSYYEEEEEDGGSGKIIGIIVILILLVGVFLAYKFVWVPKKEKEKLALLEETRKKKEQARVDSLARVAEEERLRAEAAANAKPVGGTIETLAERTGRYYVVISSSVDGDLAMDRAKKLSATGKSSKIIPPFGKWKYYRLCIGDFDSFANAQSSADASKSEYGEALWVLKY